MALSGRQRMINSVNALTGDDDCTEAVLVQERPGWAPLALVGFVVLLVVLFIAIGDVFSGNTILLGAIGGAAGGLVYASVTTYWIVARTGDQVVLAKSSRWSAKAVELVEHHDAPVAAKIHGGMLQSKVTLGDHTLFASRSFVRRLQAIFA